MILDTAHASNSSKCPSCRSSITLTRLNITIHKICARKNEVRSQDIGVNQKTYESGSEKRVRVKGT